MKLTYFVDNKLGGVTSLNFNLASLAPKEVNQSVIHIKQKEWTMSNANVDFPNSENIHFEFSGDENGYSIIKNLYKLVANSDGALILNYDIEMAMLDNYQLKHTTFQLVHDNYNLKLAKKYGHVVDVFICHNTAIYCELLLLFPERQKDVFLLPHGVKIPSNCRKHKGNEDGPVKLLFLGRMASSKGIFDLPKISKLLKARNVHFEWTCIGSGPELKQLQSEWTEEKVNFYSPATNDEVLQIASTNDIFVLPTKFEGSPVSLVETMSVGLVPVITQLPGGITDIVKEDIGYTIALDHNEGFADAIAELYLNRNLLKKLSEQCRVKIELEFDLKRTAKKYHDLFAKYQELYKCKKIRKMKVGARLDHPLIPSRVVQLIRRLKK